MQIKLFTLLCGLFFLIHLQAQDSADNKTMVHPDSFQTVSKTSDGKIVTVGTPVTLRPFTVTDHVKMFFTALYERYPVWCWIASIFILFSILRLIKRFIAR